MKTRNTEQLEFGLAGKAARVTLNARQRRLHRAAWWFDRMRQVVDRAFDWQPAPPPPGEQLWFSAPPREAAFRRS